MRYLAFLLSVGTLAAQWDSVGNRNMVLGKLYQRERQPENPFCESAGCTVKHEVIGEYDVPYKTRKGKLIVATSTDPNHDCHGCGPALSFFEFSLRGKKWELTESYFAVLQWGQFGGAYQQGITVEALGDDLYGIFLPAGSTNQGITSQSTTILARIGKELSVVATIPTLEDTSGGINPGASDWSATISVDPGPARVHGLIVTTSGVKDGEKIAKTERYKFNGKEYVPD
jgi:hypothetical protein